MSRERDCGMYEREKREKREKIARRERGERDRNDQGDRRRRRNELEFTRNRVELSWLWREPGSGGRESRDGFHHARPLLPSLTPSAEPYIDRPVPRSLSSLPRPFPTIPSPFTPQPSSHGHPTLRHPYPCRAKRGRRPTTLQTSTRWRFGTNRLLVLLSIRWCTRSMRRETELVRWRLATRRIWVCRRWEGEDPREDQRGRSAIDRRLRWVELLMRRELGLMRRRRRKR